MLASTFSAFVAHAQAQEPKEACGLILRVEGKEVYHPCGNVAERHGLDPCEAFWIDEEDWIRGEDSGEVLALCHSHPGTSPEPGMDDLLSIPIHGIPWFILGEGQTLQRVDSVIQPMEERPFEYGWNDCYSLVRDWFLLHRGIRLRDVPREPEPWNLGRSPYLENMASFGFIEADEPREGDLLLMKVRSKTSNHAGIYLGDGRVLHHLWNQLSRIEDASRYSITHVLRLP